LIIFWNEEAIMQQAGESPATGMIWFRRVRRGLWERTGDGSRPLKQNQKSVANTDNYSEERLAA